jgi:hypothetical protein
MVRLLDEPLAIAGWLGHAFYGPSAVRPAPRGSSSSGS